MKSYKPYDVITPYQNQRIYEEMPERLPPREDLNSAIDDLIERIREASFLQSA